MKIMGRRVVCAQCQRDFDPCNMFLSDRSGTGQGKNVIPVPQLCQAGPKSGALALPGNKKRSVVTGGGFGIFEPNVKAQSKCYCISSEYLPPYLPSAFSNPRSAAQRDHANAPGSMAKNYVSLHRSHMKAPGYQEPVPAGDPLASICRLPQ